MNLDAIFHLLAAARDECGHADYVVIGSLSVLGMEQVSAIPTGMTLSIDADCYTPADPGRIYDLKPALGEGSPFHRKNGYFLDPVSPKLPTLPEGWEQRLVRVERSGVIGWFLEPNDAAISKLARGEPRDLRWVRAGVEAGLVSLPLVRLRVRDTSFLDDDERDATIQRLDALGPKRRSR
ncbi:DUF6036 family nucleotidyltransferase [Ramlibacter albus]|uniref:DUF6036 domain-containing protein n=1 Tax=Ramlibacter albus TaxID=2079448 RepID=A0A923S751_9BURK|nr:DUF6036 family nucleotidyltransferase [Ramlibacter albus]MBC5766807.1 hypothetical protein [Ramlibacter albus]